MSRLKRKLEKWGIRRRPIHRIMKQFAAGPEDQTASADAGPIERAFFDHEGYVVHKWHHYLPLYDRYFEPYRRSSPERPIRFLEIGVFRGGSLEIWRDYFGEDAVIFGIDIDEKCRALDGLKGTSVRIGSQADAHFLEEVVEEMGGVDIVLDDGSHMMSHMRQSFECLFPMLEKGGLYVVEDLQCAYWKQFGGGYHRRGTFIEMAKQMVDEIHSPWHGRRPTVPAARDDVGAIHVHDSMLFIEKVDGPASRVHSQQGNTASPADR